MYSTDFDSFRVRDVTGRVFQANSTKAHAPLFCTHAEDLRFPLGDRYSGDDLLSYSDFLPRFDTWKRFSAEHYAPGRQSGWSITWRIYVSIALRPSSYRSRIRWV